MSEYFFGVSEPDPNEVVPGDLPLDELPSDEKEEEEDDDLYEDDDDDDDDVEDEDVVIEEVDEDPSTEE